MWRQRSTEEASPLLADAYRSEGVPPGSLVLHMDNGSPMNGATFVATLQKLGVMTSYSRPSASSDNPYSESLFRTMKYRPCFPSGPFASMKAARGWVTGFFRWYNTEHLHSGIRFVTPTDRHSSRDLQLFDQRRQLYEKARARKPERLSGNIRNWDPIEEVLLNPETTVLGQTG